MCCMYTWPFFFMNGEKGKTDNFFHNSILPTDFSCDMELLTVVQAPASWKTVI